MSITKGKYFDGKSSQLHEVEVILDTHTNELKIHNDNLNISWEIYNISYEKIGNMLEIRKEERTNEFLSIYDAGFNTEFINFLHKTKDVGIYKKLLNLSFSKHIAIFGGLLTLIVLGYFFLVPVIAEKSVVLIPKSFDKQISKMALTNFGYKTDSIKSEILTRFAQNMELNNQTPLNFKVVDSPIVNAYSLPDGTVMVFTGILQKMNSYDQLAGLIGHEVSHINKRHAVKMLCRNLAGYIFISALFSDVNGIMTVIAQNAQNLNNLTYSRQFESEADEESTLLMIQNHINPKGMVSLMKVLQKEQDIKLPEIISTHPETTNRIKDIEQIIKDQSYKSTNHPYLKSLFVELGR